jgi:major type 1 subunit fimbrin (pilin)
MNKTLLSAALIAGFGVAAFAPQAAKAASGGTINFTGKVFNDTCTVTVNNGNTVVLPVVATSSFGSTVGAANTSSATNFNVALTTCDNNLVSGQMAFTNGATVDAANGFLKNTLTSSNSNVEIELLSGANVINTFTQSHAPLIAIGGGTTTGTATGSTTITAEYVTTAAATTAGLVSSSVAFTLTYL